MQHPESHSQIFPINEKRIFRHGKHRSCLSGNKRESKARASLLCWLPSASVKQSPNAEKKEKGDMHKRTPTAENTASIGAGQELGDCSGG